MSPSKKIDLRDFAAGVYQSQTRDTVSHVGITAQLCELLPLSPTLCGSTPPTPHPYVNKYTVYTYTVYKGGGYEVPGPQSPVTGQFFR